MGILSAAQAFQKLFDYEYQFIVVKNRNTSPIEIKLRFSNSDFHHLCGLHKLVDIYATKNEKRDMLFSKIIQGKYSNSIFEKSVSYEKITDRIECLENLETILNGTTSIYKFNKNANKYSSIKSDFIIKNEYTDIKRYFFIVRNDKEEGQYLGCSCFERSASEPDYSIGHTEYKILKKSRVKLSTQEKEDLYVAPSYSQEIGNTQKLEINQFNVDISNGAITLNPIHIFSLPDFKKAFAQVKQSVFTALKRLFNLEYKSQKNYIHQLKCEITKKMNAYLTIHKRYWQQ